MQVKIRLSFVLVELPASKIPKIELNQGQQGLLNAPNSYPHQSVGGGSAKQVFEKPAFVAVAGFFCQASGFLKNGDDCPGDWRKC